MSEELTPWQRYKEKLGDTRPWDFLDPNTEYVLEEERNNRLDICKACPEFVKLTTTCKQCGCFMAAKTKLAEASCPLGKW
jgi:hypothetical protein